MSYQKCILFCKKIHNITRINLFATNLLVNKINYINTNNIVRPICTSCFRLDNTASLESVKSLVDINEFKRLNYCGTKYVPLTLQKILNLSLIETRIFIKTYPKFRKCSAEQIDKNYKFYKQEGITDETIKRCPTILALQDIELRMEHVKQLSLDINNSAPLLSTNLNTLRRMVKNAIVERNNIPYGNRIIHLSKTLNIPEWQISAKLVEHNYITRLPIERLDNIIKVLTNYGIDSKNIMNDFWALRYSPELAEKRLQRALDANVDKLRTWMIRCPDSVFDRCINRQVENRKILGADSSVEEYLSKRLQCSIDNAKYLTEKYPAIEKMNISKMKEMMDFLFEQGYTPGHICRVPRILIHSLETTKSRLTHLNQLGIIPPSLAILCKSKRDFDKYIKKYKKKNNLQSETNET